MVRKVIKIDEKKCNGCGLCATACQEGAIAIIDGKARLVRDDYCDGLGNCLPACPMEAISFEEREAAAFDEEAVKRNMQRVSSGMAETIRVKASGAAEVEQAEIGISRPGALNQWPVQIKLLPEKAPYFDQAELLVAADCTAFAYGNFHEEFLKGRALAMGCPKLDGMDYSDKLAEIIRKNEIQKILVLRMEVPCCRGMVFAVESAIEKSGKNISWSTVVVSTEGVLLEA